MPSSQFIGSNLVDGSGSDTDIHSIYRVDIGNKESYFKLIEKKTDYDNSVNNTIIKVEPKLISKTIYDELP